MGVVIYVKITIYFDFTDQMVHNLQLRNLPMIVLSFFQLVCTILLIDVMFHSFLFLPKVFISFIV
jgi:hypothetical protein